MQASPQTRDLITKAINRAINLISWLPLQMARDIVRELELAKLLVNK